MMASTNLHTTDAGSRNNARRTSTETKASVNTTELIAYLGAVVGVLIASAVVDGDRGFGTTEAWKLITFLTIGYMVRRGLAKSGSRDFYDDDVDHSNR